MSAAKRAAAMIEAGIAAETRGDAAEAERMYRLALSIDPRSARAHLNIGIALQARGETKAAAAAHAEAVRLDPALAAAHYNLALASMALGETEAAEQEFRFALRLCPEFPEALVGLAEALESRGRDQEALVALETAVLQRSQYAGAVFNLAVLLRKLGRLDEAEAHLRSIREDHAEYANVMTALAATLRDLGRIDEAVDALRIAVDRAPNSRVAQSELLFTLGFSDRISAEELFAEHLRAGSRAEAEVAPWCAEFANSPDPERILNIGFLSGDFAGTSVALFVEFLFERHRRDRVRIYAYSSTPQHDAVTAKFVATADGWRELSGKTDASVARAILDDRIDVLVDLTGHTSNRRTGVLVGRAAPVQMTWLGYINTTGLTRVGYRITDPVADPVGMTESLHTERLLRMPHSQWCFRPPEKVRTIEVTRDQSSQEFTFGSFNQFAKVSGSTIALWVGALRAAPGTRLRVVGVPRGTASATLAGKLEAAHIDRSRFYFVERMPMEIYYTEHTRVDACLDTTPYSGGTTTCDALWMGVPVVTLAGKRSMSRSAASLVTTVGRPDLIAQTPEEFVAIASRLALQGPWPTDARAQLRERMMVSALMDERRFAEDLEDLYRRAWREWCGGR
jgi:predicted O-linked N-acetylglucosamine transferase (SPINDLY family)